MSCAQRQHDAYIQLNSIQQALSQNKKPIGFFIGAGCPLSVRINLHQEDGKDISAPIIPDIAGLTGRISEKLKSAGKGDFWDKLIALMHQDKKTNPNIEDLLTLVRALRNVAGRGEVRGFTKKDLDSLDQAICNIIHDEVNKILPDNQSPYHNLAIWIRAINRALPIHIFTTNYDLLIEQALEESAVPYFDGFIGTRKAFFDLGAVEDESSLPPRWARLWKIHGSISWKLDNQEKIIRSDQIEAENRHLIYPSHLKYDQSRKMPYLAMLDRLKDFLFKTSSLLFISGYSFSDEHINDILCRGLESNPTCMIYAFLYGKLDDEKYQEARNCALKNPNLSLFAFDKAIIGRVSASWFCRENSQNEDNSQANNLDDIIVTSGGDEKNIEVKLGDFLLFSKLLRNLSGELDSDEKRSL